MFNFDAKVLIFSETNEYSRQKLSFNGYYL